MNYKKEVARDFVALGSLVFYLIVFVRAVIIQYMPYIYHLLIALVLVTPLLMLIKKSNSYIARGFILAVFVSLFYQDILFTTFAIVLVILMAFSLDYLKTKQSEIAKGLLSGVIATVASYYITLLII